MVLQGNRFPSNCGVVFDSEAPFAPFKSSRCCSLRSITAAFLLTTCANSGNQAPDLVRVISVPRVLHNGSLSSKSFCRETRALTAKRQSKWHPGIYDRSRSVKRKEYVHKDARILDYGCGAGGRVYELFDAGYTNASGYDVLDYLKLRDPADRSRFHIAPDCRIPSLTISLTSSLAIKFLSMYSTNPSLAGDRTGAQAGRC